MANNNGNEPTVIVKKKKKKGGGGGHGSSAWKIALADFMTALMCIFLVLWLTNVTTEEQQEGIADHFNPMATNQDTDHGRDSFFSGKDPKQVEGQQSSGGRDQITRKLQQAGSPGSQSNAETVPKEAAENIAEEIRRQLATSGSLDELSDAVQVERTENGLLIRLVDTNDFAMFKPGSARLTEGGERLLTEVSDVVRLMPQDIAITGHTDARPYNGEAFTSNWALSAGRADRARMFMRDTEIKAERFQRIEGVAAEELLKPDKPEAPENRRISLLLIQGTGVDDPQERARYGDGKKSPWLDITAN